MIQYDVFFFKGGDQYKYYELYQNSKVSEAIENKFTEGGVIMGTSAGMAILSKVFYSAEQSSLYPDEALRDMNSKNITLKNDFLDVLDGIIVDTHFAERGRFPRLLAFMGHWKISTGENLVGIGVDDKTALCIDENLNAIAYGTGAVSIYQMNDFNTDENKPVADDIKVTHLLNEMEYDLEVMQITSDYKTNTSAYQDAEKLKNTLYLSGSDAISHNEELLNLLIANTSGSIVLVSKNGSTLIQSYESYIQNNSDLHVISIETVLGEECQGVSERNQIRKANTMIIVDFDQELFAEFFKDDQTGQLLLDKMKRSESQVAFIGSSSALAGGYFCTNNVEDELNAYYGALEYQAGLGLLATTLIMPNTFDPSTSSYYENNTSAVLYGMISHKLGYGLYLNEQSYITITPLEGENVLTSSGKYSAILVKNNSQMGDLADQKVNNSGYLRNVVGFDEMTYHLVSGQKIVIGEPDKSEESTLIAELEAPFNLNAIWQEGNFLNVPYLESVITDTHYDNPDRRGKHITFMARMNKDWGMNAKGIGVDEATAVCIDGNGRGYVFGDGIAFFLSQNGQGPERCQSRRSLDWYRNRQAIRAHLIQGNSQGSRYFNLASWSPGTGESSQYYYVDRGRLKTSY